MSTETVLLVLNHDTGVAEYWFEFPGDGWKAFETRPLEDNERQTHIPGIQEKIDAVPEDGGEVED